ncbi:KLTH0C04928p [Lachancea thermotolerans CBS 6340]|uniref:KLTH0C04928p n=1 Tax=Lachancea thermotolerans (strain ATCC 56472 / CBS 6340 / NRRL Y-8284) TaxID=559295 RepID=C5DDZ0_LACTC|nr:KLTH0C04928p [Lachancea thermotolerans CBS 6340]CAR22001.1 KLTH0C04928p [Lachancea thermotolerans CBS 6340]
MLRYAVLRCAQKHARPRNRCLRASGRGEARSPPRQGRRGHVPIHVRYFVRCLLSMVYVMYMRCRVRLRASAPRRAVGCYNTTGRSDAIWRRRLRNAAVCASAVLAEHQGGSPRSRGPTSSKTPEVAPTVSHGGQKDTRHPYAGVRRRKLRGGFRRRGGSHAFRATKSARR